MLKYKNFIDKKLDQLDDLKDEYSRRVDQKLIKKFGFKSSNSKAMHKNEDSCGEISKQPPLHTYEKKMKYLKVPPDENAWQVEVLANNSDQEDQKCLQTDIYDEYQHEQDDNQKSDFLQMALYYKKLCRTYKKQLIESHKTIKELNATIDQMEHKHWIQKRQKTSLQLAVTEREETMKSTFNKCKLYCDKINKIDETVTAYSSSGQNSSEQEEFIFNTLKNVIKEKKEIKVFFKSYSKLVSLINPNCSSILQKRAEPMSFSILNSINSEAVKYLQENAIQNCSCKCRSRNVSSENSDQLAVGQFSDSTSSSSSSLAVSSHDNKSRPSVEYLVKCINLVQELFDIDCFHGIPTALNDVYYKLGQLNNFKKNIQNVFAPNKNYSLERLVNAVQITHSQLNDQLGNNLRSIFHSSNLNGVIDKFNMYDEYFPLFRELLDQIMKHLEISRLDQILPSIKALKILAIPTGGA